MSLIRGGLYEQKKIESSEHQLKSKIFMYLERKWKKNRKKNQNWVASGYLKGNNLQKNWGIQPKFRFFSIPIAITQKVLKLQIPDCVHWKANIISFLKNTIWSF